MLSQNNPDFQMTVAHRFSESKYWKIQCEVIPTVTPINQKSMHRHPIERGPELNKALEFTLIRKKESDPSECQKVGWPCDLLRKNTQPLAAHTSKNTIWSQHNPNLQKRVAHRFSESKHYQIQYKIMPTVTPNNQKNIGRHPIEHGPKVNKAS